MIINYQRTCIQMIMLCLFGVGSLVAQIKEVDSGVLVNAEAMADRTPELTYRDALIFGLVEGLTEYLPVSSTGHLIIVKKWMNFHVGEDFEQAIDAYLIVIQFGAILAVFVIYWRQLASIVFGFFGLSPTGLILGRNLILAFTPAAVIGFLFHDWIKATLFGIGPVVFALIAGAVLMISVELYMKRYRAMHGGDGHGFYQGGAHLHQLTVLQCLVIGFLQCFAMWPGTSRSMMTIVGGYWVGLTPARAAEFSFLLGLITLSGASCYEWFKEGDVMMKHLSLGPSILGIIVSGISAALAIRFFVSFLSKKGLSIFAYYRILLAFVVLFFA